MKLVVATHNGGKFAEFRALFSPAIWQLESLSSLGLDLVIDEDAPTFVGNAEKKAGAAADATGLWSLGDDSGLMVDALFGAPGVRSARFAGPEQDEAANRTKLLTLLEETPDERRGAQFRAALVLVRPGGPTLCTEGTCRGRIVRAPRGNNGFGYDPLFEVEGTGQTLAEMTMEEKNRVSHRAKALLALANALASAGQIL